MGPAEAARNQPEDGNERMFETSQSKPKREVSQVTLSTIGDLSIAAENSIDRIVVAQRVTRWFSVLGFLLLVYVAICLATLFSLKNTPAVRAFLMPIFPTLIATFAFWWQQRWKVRARRASFRLRASEEAIGSLRHEASSAANAIQANLTGLRLADPQVSESEHLRAIELATARIGNAVQNSNPPKG